MNRRFVSAETNGFNQANSLDRREKNQWIYTDMELKALFGEAFDLRRLYVLADGQSLEVEHEGLVFVLTPKGRRFRIESVRKAE